MISRLSFQNGRARVARVLSGSLLTIALPNALTPVTGQSTLAMVAAWYPSRLASRLAIAAAVQHE
jgi:ABC-type lipoprotein release transport system permease subunit